MGKVIHSETTDDGEEASITRHDNLIPTYPVDGPHNYTIDVGKEHDTASTEREAHEKLERMKED